MNTMSNDNTSCRKVTGKTCALMFVLFFLLVAFSNEACSEELRCVLVAGENSSIEKLSVKDVRRVFLGLPSLDSEIVQHPVINLSDMPFFREFLKNIMRMTEDGYKRKIIKRVFRQGADHIKEVERIDVLVKHLTENEDDISFMPKSIAESTDGIKVIQELW